ncbi:MAG TPA: putative glycoside hydrolase [Acidimicrobiales bacterium]
MTSLMKKDRHRLGSRGGSLGFGPRPLHLERDDRRPDRPTRFRRLRRLDYGAIFAWVLGVGTVVLVLVLAWRGTRVHIEQTGLEDGSALNALSVAAVDVRITFESPEDAEASTLSFDGEPIEDPEVEGETMRWKPPAELDEGEHVLSLEVPRALLSDAVFEWSFVLDTTPPTIEAPPVVDPVDVDESAEVVGRVEPGATLRVDGRKAEVDADGSFAVEFRRPPAGAVAFEAVDVAGNRATTSVVVPVTYPTTRAVHVTAAAWSNRGLRDRILQMVDERRIDAVVLDLKDEEGVVGYDTEVPRAREIGAVTEYYDLDTAVATLEEHGARVIGRIAAFRDPRLAQAAWESGKRDQVIQAPGGAPYNDPGQFTNFAHPEVQRYNLDIALDAIDRGVRDIMWDEVRRPGDDPTNVVVPGIQGSHSEALVGFLAGSHTELRRRGAYQGVGVLGISVDRGDLVAQDIAQMARHTDYMVPTIHPAYWGNGEFGVANPARQPADLVSRVLTRFGEVALGSGARFVPSLQDFSARGIGYGDAEVRAQIEAARGAGAAGFVLWDPSVTYTASALDPAPPEAEEPEE